MLLPSVLVRLRSMLLANPKTLTLAILASVLSACTEPAAPVGSSSSSSSSTPTAMTGGADSADSTSGGQGQCPVVPHIDPALAQALSPDFMAVTPFDSRIGTLCPNTSHYYTLDNPCPMYLALNVRGNPIAIDNDSEDFDLVLTEHYDPSQPGAGYVVHESNGSPNTIIGGLPALPFEALHHRLEEAGDHPHLVEVRHVAGGELGYELQAIPLIDCTP
jgi:hypothetical protein